MAFKKLTADSILVGNLNDKYFIVSDYFLASRKNYGDNYVFFNSDKDFIRFCIDINNVDSEGMHPYRQEYIDSVNEKKKFVIKDEHSLIFKRGFLVYQGTAKKIDRLLGYIDDRF